MPLTGPSAEKSEGPPRPGQQQAQVRNGGELHPRTPPPRMARDHTNKASSTPQPGLAGNCSHKALLQDWRGTTHLTKASSKPPLGLAGNSTHTALRQGWRGTTPTKPAAIPSQDRRGTAPTGPSAGKAEGPPQESQQQAQTKIGGALHPQGPPPRMARDHPSNGSSKPLLGLAENYTHKALREERRRTKPT